MKLPISLAAAGVTAALALSAETPALAQFTDDVVKIGVLTDMSSLYSDINGRGALVATEMAIEDFGGSLNGRKIEIVSGDTQNKPDVASSIAGRWFDIEKVDVILGASSSSASLAVSGVAASKNKVFLAPDPASSDFTGSKCNAQTIHWTYDTIALSNGTGSAVVKSGGKEWFFLTADYAFGHALERDVTAIVTASGGKVVGSVRHPLGTTDFSSFLLQAQASKAPIIGLANAGGDTVNAIKAGAEFGIVQGGQKFAGLLVFVSDVHSLGLKMAQGLQLTEAFYWDLNDDTRKWSKRWSEKMNGRMPTSVQAGFYSATKHYLESVKAAGTDDTAKVLAKMHELPTNDPMFGRGEIRADQRKMHDMYLFEVKKPEESKGPWDYYKLVRTIPANEAFRKLADSPCELVKK